MSPVSVVAWTALNPARGDQSPLAGTLWGDRGGEVATEFHLRSVDGFESPPHAHDVSYRGIVLGGLVHNDDPTAARKQHRIRESQPRVPRRPLQFGAATGAR